MDAGRDGFVMGEGAALLVLEAAEVAEARGARALRRGLGYAATSDAHHMVQPRADGREAARAVTLALADAGVAPERDRLGERARLVDADRRHRGGAGDRARARATRAATVPVSGDEGAYRPPAGGDRGDRGRDGALAIREGWAPGTVNLVAPEPELAALLPCLLREGREGRYDRVLSTSFGFGGLNAALVLGAPRT